MASDDLFPVPEWVGDSARAGLLRRAWARAIASRPWLQPDDYEAAETWLQALADWFAAWKGIRRQPSAALTAQCRMALQALDARGPGRGAAGAGAMDSAAAGLFGSLEGGNPPFPPRGPGEIPS